MRPSSFVFQARGFTLVELMIVVAIIALLAAIAAYNVLRSRSIANETAVLGNYHALIGALEMYRGSYLVYPDDWKAQLYDNVEPDYGPLAFDVEMEDSNHQGYRYTYAGQPDGCAGDCSGYTLLSSPAVPGITGSRAFFADQTGILRHCLGEGPADVTDEPMHLAPTAC